MDFSHGKLGLASASTSSSTAAGIFGALNNNNSQIYINNNNNNSSTINNNSLVNSNAPLDLSIDAAIKEVVSKDDKLVKDIPVTSAKPPHQPPHPPHHHQLMGGGEAIRRFSANQSVTPLRFPSANNNNNNYNTGKNSLGDKTNFTSIRVSQWVWEGIYGNM